MVLSHEKICRLPTELIIRDRLEEADIMQAVLKRWRMDFVTGEIFADWIFSTIDARGRSEAAGCLKGRV